MIDHRRNRRQSLVGRRSTAYELKDTWTPWNSEPVERRARVRSGILPVSLRIVFARVAKKRVFRAISRKNVWKAQAV